MKLGKGIIIMEMRHKRGNMKKGSWIEGNIKWKEGKERRSNHEERIYISYEKEGIEIEFGIYMEYG